MPTKNTGDLVDVTSAEAAINRKPKRHVKTSLHIFFVVIFNFASKNLLFLWGHCLIWNILVIIKSKILTHFHWSTIFETKQYSFHNFYYSVQKTDYLCPSRQKNTSVTNLAHNIIRKRLRYSLQTYRRDTMQKGFPLNFPQFSFWTVQTDSDTS